MSQDIRIPDIGDAESVEVVEILVAVGDTVGADDPVVVIESDKASMEVPAGKAGVVEAIRVAIGDQVSEGQVILVLSGSSDEAAPATAAAASEAGASESSRPPETAKAPEPAKAPETANAPAPAEASAAAPASAGAAAAGPAARHEVRVPDIGEADQVVVIEVARAVGDAVQADDLLVVIESDKASMEIPVGVAGRIVELHVSEGDEVREGTLLATLETDRATAAPAPEPGPRQTAEPAPQKPASDAPATASSESAEPESAEPASGGPEPGPAPAASAGAEVYAGPAVRQLARELGVRLADVSGSGLRGRIVKDDVKAFVKNRLTQAPPAERGGALPALPVVDFSRFGETETVPMSRIRQRGADNLHRSWVNIPHVTQHDEVDVSDLEAFRKSIRAEAEAAGVKLTPLAFLIRACCQALREFPTVNSSLDPTARNYILKRYYHIGIAVDTEDGLVVPVIRDADRKGVYALAREAAELSEKARNRKLTPADHQGGTFTITSLGALGGTGFTPVINAPEVAILGVGRLTTRPHWDGTAFVPRQMLPLSLSYDHRAINGAEAGRFVARLAALLGDVRRLVL